MFIFISCTVVQSAEGTNDILYVHALSVVELQMQLHAFHQRVQLWSMTHQRLKILHNNLKSGNFFSNGHLVAILMVFYENSTHCLLLFHDSCDLLIVDPHQVDTSVISLCLGRPYCSCFSLKSLVFIQQWLNNSRRLWYLLIACCIQWLSIALYTVRLRLWPKQLTLVYSRVLKGAT